MKKSSNNTRTKINYAIIEPADRIRILWKCITKGDSSYDFYDIQYGEVIIKGASIVSGKNGLFLGMPSQERNGSYYPVAYITPALNDRLLEYIEDADDNDTWEETDDEYLQFEKVNADSDNDGNRKSNRRKNNKRDDSADAF